MDDQKRNDIPDPELEKYQKYLQEDPLPSPQPPERKPEKPAPTKPNRMKTGLLILIIVLLIGILVAGAVLAKSFKTRLTGVKNTMTTTQSTTSNVVRVTFPEGFTVYQMAQRLEENGVCSKEDFYAAVNTPVDGFSLPQAENRVFLLEGYLFPDTYEFYRDTSAANVVRKMLDNYQQKVTPAMTERAEALGFSMDEMLTLASIIQKECDMDIEECRNVSSVFHNRLRQSRESYLGSDVTYLYLKNMAEYFGGADTAAFDEKLLLYYTYSPYRKGLPVGPICNPGSKAIEAALYPSETNYQFFLTDASGKTFYYAETYEQHLQNAKTAGLS